MDYERKYKEALGWMQDLYSGLHGATKEEAEHYFPELKESEDERIRLEIRNFIWSYPDKLPERDKWLAWFEKQGEKSNTRKREIDDAYLQGICDAKHEIEMQGKELNADKVIKWLYVNVANFWASPCNPQNIINQFKKDFGL